MNVKQFYKLYNSIVEYVNAANPSAIRNSFLERSADFVNKYYSTFLHSNFKSQVEQFSDLKECFICMEVELMFHFLNFVRNHQKVCYRALMPFARIVFENGDERVTNVLCVEQLLARKPMKTGTEVHREIIH